MSAPPLDITKAKDRLFKIKKLQFNTYDIEHSVIKGQLRIITIPKNFIELPNPPGSQKSANIGVGSQTIVAFTNRGKKGTPTEANITPEMIPSEEKIDLTRFYENSYEPWSEFVLQGDPPLLVRLRTILTKITWLKNRINNQGDPMLWANSNISLEVFDESTGESGLE